MVNVHWSGFWDLVRVQGVDLCPGLSPLAPNLGCRASVWGPQAKWWRPMSSSVRSLTLLIDARVTVLQEGSSMGGHCTRQSSTSATFQIGCGVLTAGGQDRKTQVEQPVDGWSV